MGAFLNRAQLRALLLPCSTFRVHHSQMRSFKALFLGIRWFGAFRSESAQLQGTGLLSGLAGTDLRKAVMWRTYSSAAEIGGY